MKNTQTKGIMLALLIGSIVAIIALTNRQQLPDDNSDGTPVADEKETVTPVAGSNKDKQGTVENKEPLISDAELQRLISETFNPRKFEHEEFEPALAKAQREEALVKKYEGLKNEPQSIHGSIKFPEGTDRMKNGPVKLQLRTGDRYSRVGETMLDKNGHYALDPVEPGKYTLLIFETKANPGINYKNIEVVEGEVMADLDIPSPTGEIIVYVLDENGRGVSGARITVGKTNKPSGSNLNLFTWRIGTSDADGRFKAPNLTDGRYVVKAAFGQSEVSDIAVLKPKGKTEHTLRLRTSGNQITGTVRRRDPSLDTSYPVILEGKDSDGKSIRRAINTDSKGEYAISFLPPGTYKIYLEQTAHFSGTDAVVKLTKAKETLRGVDLDVYYTSELSSITGKVDNVPDSSDLLLHVLAMSKSNVMRSSTIVDKDSGEYSLEGLPPGDYTLRLVSTKKNGADPTEMSSKSVSVKADGSGGKADFSLP